MRQRGNSLSSKEIKPIQQPSGLSKSLPIPHHLKPPEVLRYPTFYGLDRIQAIKDSLCYIIKPYAFTGVSLIISRDDKSEDTMILFADWNGNKLDLMDKQNKLTIIAEKYLANDVQILINFMKLIKIKQAQYFFSGDQYEDMLLVDVQTSLNKMCGPGMLRDLFSKIMKTQEVLKVEPIDDRAIEAIKVGNGVYEGDIIIKPSRFRHYHDVDNNDYSPMYIKIKR